MNAIQVIGESLLVEGSYVLTQLKCEVKVEDVRYVSTLPADVSCGGLIRNIEAMVVIKHSRTQLSEAHEGAMRGVCLRAEKKRWLAEATDNEAERISADRPEILTGNTKKASRHSGASYR